VVADIRQLEELANLLPAFEAQKIRAFTLLPLAFRRSTWGHILLWYAEPHPFSDEELATLRLIGGQIGLALEHHRLSLELAESMANSRREEDLLRKEEFLSGADAVLSATLDPLSTLEELARLVVPVLADHGLAYALGPDEKSIRRVGSASGPADSSGILEHILGMPVPRFDDQTGVGMVVRTGRMIFAPDLRLPDRGAQMLEEGQRQELQSRGALSLIVAPLRARNRMLGALTLLTTTASGRLYTQREVFLAEELASRAGLFVDNARLFSQASRAIRARDETLAVVSHDLRNPLNTIVTACELLDRQLPPQRRGTRAHQSIRQATQQMNRLIQDLLDIARIEGGALALRVQPLPVSSLFADAVTLIRLQVDERLARLEVDAEENLPELRGDRDRLLQVLSNLLGNAIQVIPRGGLIRLVARRVEGAVRIEVVDTGPGIDPEQLPRIFERFWRAERDRRQGAGLGLSIAKGIVEAHGGAMGVNSHPGRGTTFSFGVPACDAGTSPRARGEPSEVAPTDHP